MKKRPVSFQRDLGYVCRVEKSHLASQEPLFQGAVSSPAQSVLRLGLFLFACGVLLSRAPNLLLFPRFWAEEATEYFAYAYSHTFWETLFFFQKSDVGGYFNLAASLPAALAGSLFSVESAPLVTTFFSFAVMLLPVSVLTFGSSYLWNSLFSRCFALLFIFLAPTATPEVWMNSINSQVFLGVFTFLILFENFENRSIAWKSFCCFMLLFAGLSGVYAIFLVPAFCARLYARRDPVTLLLVCCLLLCACIQGGLFLSGAVGEGGDVRRFSETLWSLGPSSVFINHYLFPILGRELAYEAWHDVLMERASMYAWWGSILGALFLFITAWSATLVKEEQRQWFIVGFVGLLTVSFCTMISAFDGIAGGRYAVVPSVSFLLLIVALIRFTRSWWLSLILTFGLGVSLSSGFAHYWNDPFFRCRKNCPKWDTEVAIWRKDSSYCPRVFPFKRRGHPGQWRVCLKP